MLIYLTQGCQILENKKETQPFLNENKFLVILSILRQNIYIK